MINGKVSYRESVDGWMYSKHEENTRVCRCCGERKSDEHYAYAPSHVCRECEEWVKSAEVAP